jgi:hypothetical protein
MTEQLARATKRERKRERERERGGGGDQVMTTSFFFRLSSFYSSFKTGFSSNFLFEFQVVRKSNRLKFEGPLYLVPSASYEGARGRVVG